jgi:O-antigen/teichoic acid export membrane protein
VLGALKATVHRSFGLDRPVALALAGRMWTLGAGFVTTVLIAVFFAPEVQGYYYTFNAVLALAALAELGLGTVLVSYASHEWASLRLDERSRVTGDPGALSRLASLGRFALAWYAVASTLATVALLAGGLVFFGSAQDAVSSWRAQWIALCIVTGLNFCAVPVLALLEGCNQVSNVYAYRLVQYVASSVAAWLTIWLGAGLWVAAVVGLTGLVATVLTVGRRYSGFVRTVFLTRPSGPRIDWRTDILPMQWRMALSWIGGYFMFSLFTPVLFHYRGPTVAGQMGMTWAFVGALMSVASAWVSPRAPGFGILIAQERYDELDRAFWRLTGTVLAVTGVGATAVWGGTYFLYASGHRFAERLLPPATTAYLLLATLIVCSTLPMAMYLRAHKREPLMALSVTSGVLTGVAVVVLGKAYSANGVAIGYLAVAATVTPLVAMIWRSRRAEWHRAGARK